MVVILIAVILIVVVYWNIQQNEADRNTIGLHKGDTVLSMDDSREYPGMILYSNSLPLYGKPDRIVKKQGYIIPVEEKHNADRLYESHRIQALAYCLLVEERFSCAPPYAIVRLKGGKEIRLPWNSTAKEKLKGVLARAFAVLSGQVEARGAGDYKCKSCGYKAECCPVP